MNNIYDVILETSIGERHGKMDVSIRDKSIKGILRILKGEEPFEGIVDASGQCRISGNLSTLMRRMPSRRKRHFRKDLTIGLGNLLSAFWKDRSTPAARATSRPTPSPTN